MQSLILPVRHKDIALHVPYGACKPRNFRNTLHRLVQYLRRAVFTIEAKKEGENLVLETMRGLYVAGSNDFVTAVDSKYSAPSCAVLDSTAMKPLLFISSFRAGYGTVSCL